MRLPILLTLSVLLSPLAAVDGAGGGVPTPVVVPGATSLAMTVPAAFTMTKVQPAPTLPPTFKFASRTGKMSLQITFMPHGRIDTSSQEGVSGMVARVGHAQYESGSVEKATTVVPLRIADGLGAIAWFTDADLVGVADLRPDQFRVVGCGVMAIGDTAGVITLLADDRQAPEVQAAIDLIQGGIAKAKDGGLVAAP